MVKDLTRIFLFGHLFQSMYFESKFGKNFVANYDFKVAMFGKNPVITILTRYI